MISPRGRRKGIQSQGTESIKIKTLGRARNSNEYVEASDSVRIADLTLEIEIFVRIMSRSSLLSCTKISMEI